jgi:hypothetical protein
MVLWHETWTSYNWKHVIWSGASSFKLFSTSWKVYIWRSLRLVSNTWEWVCRCAEVWRNLICRALTLHVYSILIFTESVLIPSQRAPYLKILYKTLCHHTKISFIIPAIGRGKKNFSMQFMNWIKIISSFLLTIRKCTCTKNNSSDLIIYGS